METMAFFCNRVSYDIVFGGIVLARGGRHKFAAPSLSSCNAPKCRPRYDLRNVIASSTTAQFLRQRDVINLSPRFRLIVSADETVSRGRETIGWGGARENTTRQRVQEIPTESMEYRTRRGNNTCGGQRTITIIIIIIRIRPTRQVQRPVVRKVTV